jgi:hypothetical protein
VDFSDAARVVVHGEYLITIPQEVDQITTNAAASVKNPHIGRDSASEDLVEEIDIDFA